ncbi:hypothetical protein L1987_26375 [Smallanthus sonchifolius]|uniref:Uncharacterized protein n=1 Tax=Smallanthus sonchifolius TaxID=185202 RepID=A0ACB9I9K2_9ASTR|nr:hypothetical protein L1987_26375 [Smallanthus sonchifolius]
MEDAATTVPPSLWASLNSWFTSTVFFILLNLMIATIVFTSNLPNNNQPQQQQEDEQKPNQPQIARSPSILHRLKSFNFNPQKSQPESSPDTHYHQLPSLEVAATQYVFNPPLQYQHFDFDSTNSDQFDAAEDSDSAFDFDPTGLEMITDTGFDFDPTRLEISRETRFDFDPTRKETRADTGFDFDTAEEEHADEFQSLDEVYSKLKTGGHDRTKSDGSIPSKPPAKLKMKKSASLKVGFSHLEEEEIVEARRPATVRENKSAVRVADDDDVEVDSRADDFINKFKNDLKLQKIESIIRKGATNRGAGK